MELLDWLKKQDKTQLWLADKLGENPKSVNNWIKGRSRIPERHEAALAKLGFRWKTQEISKQSQDYAGISTGNVSDAWAILHEACHASNAQPMRVDVKAFGRLLAMIAEKASQGKGENVRQELQEMAQDFVGAMGKAPR